LAGGGYVPPYKKVCVNFKAVGGPTVGGGNKCIKGTWHKDFTSEAAKWVWKNPILKTLFNSGAEVFKGATEAAKASGSTWGELAEVLKSIPW
jgi:hypothetical protein